MEDQGQPTPVETVVAQEPATEPAKPETKTFTQEELDAILEKRLAKERRKYIQAQRRIGELTAQVPKKDEPGKSDDAPKRESFESYEEYLEAKAAYRAEKAAEKLLAERENLTRKQREELEEKERADTWAKRQKLGREKYKDFDDVVGNDEVPITKAMAEAIMEADLGYEVAYYLGKHPEEAERIADLSPARQAVEIGKLEAKLSESPKPKASQAPEPISPVKGGGVADGSLNDDLPMSEWIKRRQKQVRGK